MSVYPLWTLESEKETPVMKHYRPEKKQSDWSVVIFPGGGYAHLAPHEGQGYAEFLNEAGINAFVVEYRVAPNTFPAPLADARRAIRLVRHKAEALGIDPNKIAVMGSSAGGHLAALVSTYKETLPGEEADDLAAIPFLPNAQILCYPVIRLTGDFCHVGSGKNLLAEQYEALAEQLCPELLVTDQTPPAFVWHTYTDDGVPVQNSLAYVTALKKHEVSAELHIFPQGPHGMGLAKNLNGRGGMDESDPVFVHVSQWGNLLLNWIKTLQ